MKPIQVFYRTCYHSPNQDLANRSRPDWFSKEKCFKNFKKTLNPELVDYTVVYDSYHQPDGDGNIPPMIKSESFRIRNIGSEAGSFLETLNLALRTCNSGQIVYFLEDDYLHTNNWCDKMLEGFELGADYLTGLDHGDKYRDYPALKSKLFVSDSCHWRTTPSTTNTFAVKYETLVEDAEIHRKYSENLQITQDWANIVTGKQIGRAHV